VATGATLWQPLYAQTPIVPFQVGSWSPSGQNLWIGAIDDLAIYNLGLDAAVIQRHYQTMLVGATTMSLRISRAGADVTLSWDANAMGWTLEFATSLPAANWSPVPGVANNSVSVSASGTAKFFRLRNGP
jgi:hypothetical protein